MAKTVRNIKEYKNIKNKIVGIRADFDINIVNGEIIDERKIKAIIPTIEYLLENKCKIIIIADLGDPKGMVDDNLSLMPIRFLLGRLLIKQIKFANIDHCENSIKFMDFGEILLLENIKFKQLETSGSSEKRIEMFKPLLKLLDIFVIDSVNISQKYSSVSILSEKLPTYYSVNYMSELELVSKLKIIKKEPITFLIGGTNIVSKLQFVKHFANSKTIVLASGKLGIYLHNKKIKLSLLNLSSREKSEIDKLLALLAKKKVSFILPVDFAVKLDGKNSVKQVKLEDLKNLSKAEIIDIGDKTINEFKISLEKATNIIVYGAVGKFENDESKNGTETLLNAVAFSTNRDALKISIGNSNSEAISLLKIKEKRFSFISNTSLNVLDLL